MKYYPLYSVIGCSTGDGHMTNGGTAPGLAGFDAIWAGNPEDADVVGGQLKERSVIEPLVTAGKESTPDIPLIA